MIVLCIMKESESGSYLGEIKLSLKAVVVIHIYYIRMEFRKSKSFEKSFW